MIAYITKTATGKLVTDHGPGVVAYVNAKREAVELELVVVARKICGAEDLWSYTFKTLHDYTRKEVTT